jgi:hypothetical protein
MLDKRFFILLGVIVVVSLLSAIFVLRGQTIMLPWQVQQLPMQDMKSTFPKVDYSYASALEVAQKENGRKYERVKTTLDPNISGDEKEVIFADWEVGVKALPVDKSSLVVVGAIAEAKAFLSNNKQGVYSQFKILVDKVFKDETGGNIKGGGYILAERNGGIVRFPSGFEKWIYVNGQGMPEEKGKYLFFLSRDFPLIGRQENDLHILTAYRLTDETVIALDSPGAERSPFRAMTGKTPRLLFAKLEDELKNSQNSEGQTQVNGGKQ